MRRPAVGRGGVAALCALAVLLLVIGGTLLYVKRQILDPQQFADRGMAVIEEEPVREFIAAELASNVVEAGSPDLVALRPLVEATLSTLIRSGALDRVLREALVAANRRLFAGATGPLVLNLKDAIVVANGVVNAARPNAKVSLPDAETVGRIGVADATVTPWVTRAQPVRVLGIVLPALAVLLLAGAALLARERRRAVTAAGIAVAAAGLLIVVAMAIAKPILLDLAPPAARDAAEAAWDGMVGSLSRWGLILVGLGAIVAGAAASVLPRVDVASGLRIGWALATARPAGRAGAVAQGARAVAAVAIGALAVADPSAVLTMVMTLAGAVLITWGVSELLRLGARPPEEGASRELVDVGRRRGVVAASVIGGLAVIGLVGLGIVAMATGGAAPAAAASAAPCNGDGRLCDRRLDQVALATSHNAMSVADQPGWFNAHHYRPITSQLDAGVRGLLVDTHLGQATTKAGFGGTVLVQTDLKNTTRADLVAEIGPEAVAAAERLSGSLVYGGSVATPHLYLCHALCEIGWSDAEEEFRGIRRWLDANPDQVVVMVIQDETPPADTIAALEESGLSGRAWPARLAPGTPLPTLREMIDAGRTLVVMHESPGTQGPSWYQDAYAVTQETPYAQKTVADIRSDASCAPNRGPKDAPLFLLNHWLAKQPVRTSEATAVNVESVLLARARRCQELRGLLPNLVAVNFVEIGDLSRVVDELNGVADPEPVPPPSG